MTFDSPLHAFSLILQVFLLDLILSGDNAVVIALSCRSLPPRQLKQALLLGTGAAIALRVLLTAVVSMLLRIPMLKLIGGALLIVIAIRLLIEEEHHTRATHEEASSSLWSAVMTVLAADLVMSLDNVVALAAVTQGNVVYLVIGLLLSVLLLMYSSSLMISLLKRYPVLIPAAGALLGYVAGNIAVSDPAIADWVNTQSPALTGVVPLLCAAFVVAQSRIIQRRRSELPRPATLATQAVPRAPANALESPARAGSTASSAVFPPVSASHAARDPEDREEQRPEFQQQDITIGSKELPGSMAVTMQRQEHARPANYFGLRRLIGNPVVQASMSVLLAIFCILFLPKTLDIIILIGIVALMLFKIF